MSVNADYPFKGYDNFVLQEIIESVLETKMDMNKFMTADYSLTEHPGMVKKIHRYVGSGQVDDLARGEGNTHYIDAEYTEEEYRVARTQGACKWYDDDQMTDPTLVETKLKTVAEKMVNDWTDKSIAEFNKTTKHAVMSTYNLGDFADAIAEYSNEYEDQAGLFFLCDIALVPTLRKQLGDYLKYTEGYIRTGAIGDILGVPIYTSRALPKGMMFLATRDAVHAFFKKDVFVEQKRDVDKKENFSYASRYTVIALVDETKCIKCGKAQATASTLTTPVAAAVAIAGSGTNGAKVTAYVNGVKAGSTATISGGSYSITVDALASGDKVKVVVELEGFLPEYHNATVA